MRHVGLWTKRKFLIFVSYVLIFLNYCICWLGVVNNLRFLSFLKHFTSICTKTISRQTLNVRLLDSWIGSWTAISSTVVGERCVKMSNTELGEIVFYSLYLVSNLCFKKNASCCFVGLLIILLITWAQLNVNSQSLLHRPDDVSVQRRMWMKRRHKDETTRYSQEDIKILVYRTIQHIRRRCFSVFITVL